MAITVKHKFVSAIPDSDDTSVVRPSNWNDDHDLTGTIPVANGGTGASTADGAVTNLLPSQTGNTGKYLTTDGTNTSWSANASGDVVGPASATDNAITRFDGTTGKLIQNSVTTIDDTGNASGILSQQFSNGSAVTLAAGKMWYDGSTGAWNAGMGGGNITQQIGEELFVYGKASAAITDSPLQIVYHTGTVGASGVITFAPTIAGITDENAIMGVATENIAHNGFGRVTAFGVVRGITTNGTAFGETWADDDVIWYNPVTGNPTKVKPVAPNIKFQIGNVIKAGAGGSGSFQVSLVQGTALGGTDSNVQLTSPTSGQQLVYNGTIWQNSNAPTITGGTINGTVIGGTTPAAGTFTTITGQTEVLRGTGQNLLVRSQEFNDVAWTRSNTTVTANTTVAPDGTTTADTITASAGNSQHDAGLQGLTVSNGISYTISVFAKAGTNNFIQLLVNGDGFPYANFDLSTGVVGTSSTGTASISSAANGFYRCVFTYTTTGTTGYPIIDIVPSSSSARRPTWTAAGTETVILWGAQFEIGSTANTYVPTTTTAVYGTPTLSFSGVAGLGLQSDGSLYVSPAGTGALQAQATTSTAAGGNARGANAVDWQTVRSAANQVASGAYSVICGGGSYGAPAGNAAGGIACFTGGGWANTSGTQASTVAGGNNNTATALNTAILGGSGNNAIGNAYSSIVGGQSNTGAGFFSFIGGGFTNSTTASAAVTTQSATMNGTTAVTLSATNANIKVGQLITGTSIASYTYVSAISGTSLTLSQSASGSSTSTLSFYTPHGVVVGGGNNQATGSYSFIGGGGDAGTAANRNVASGDWSSVLGGFKNTATNLYDTVGGGFTNAASGGYCVIGGGQNQIATGSNSSILGGRAHQSNAGYASIVGGYGAFSKGVCGVAQSGATYFSNIGDAQSVKYVLSVQTTNATATALTTNQGAAGSTTIIALPNNQAYAFQGAVIARNTSNGDTSSWEIKGAIKRGANAAATALVGTPTVTSIGVDAGAVTWALAVSADTTNGGLSITATGVAATTIRWVAQITTAEVG